MSIFDLLIAYFAGAIAFAGFMGIVSQIDRRTVRASPLSISFRIRILAVSSLLLMFLSVFPFLELGFSVDPAVAWRMGCAVAAAIVVVNLVAVILVTGRLRTARRSEAHPVNALLIWVNNLLSLGALALGIAGACGWVRPDGAYLAVASFYLWVVASTFLHIVLMLDNVIRERA